MHNVNKHTSCESDVTERSKSYIDSECIGDDIRSSVERNDIAVVPGHSKNNPNASERDMERFNSILCEGAKHGHAELSSKLGHSMMLLPLKPVAVWGLNIFVMLELPLTPNIFRPVSSEPVAALLFPLSVDFTIEEAEVFSTNAYDRDDDVVVVVVVVFVLVVDNTCASLVLSLSSSALRSSSTYV
ncbi:hypothetical protein GQX74_015505 [Glossina fuscipes]|nr:hypothetical protein GQX74_015505 [Glossina fuscipes]